MLEGFGLFWSCRLDPCAEHFRILEARDGPEEVNVSVSFAEYPFGDSWLSCWLPRHTFAFSYGLWIRIVFHFSGCVSSGEAAAIPARPGINLYPEPPDSLTLSAESESS